MTAIALEIDNLPPETKKALWSIVADSRSKRFADLMVGYPTDDDLDPLMMADVSLDDQVCIDCGCQIENASLALYEFDDGEPAFYLCGVCEQDYIAFGNDDDEK